MSQPAAVTAMPGAEQLLQGAPEKVTTTETGKTGEVAQEEVVEIDLSNLRRDGDGYILSDPSNPEKTVYRGKTPNEVIENMMKGIVEKDKYISQLKASGITGRKFAGRKVEGEDEEAGEKVEFPKPDEVLSSTAKEHNLALEVLGWPKEKWREYEAENGAAETWELKQLAAKVRESASARINAGNIDAMNRSTFLEEEAVIRQLAADSGIDVALIDWDKVFDEATSNKASYNRAGLRKSGAVVSAAAREINKLVREKKKEDFATEIEADIREGRLTARQVSSSASVVAPSQRKTDTAPKNSEQAYERALERFK